MALQKCQVCRERYAVVEHEMVISRHSYNVCFICRAEDLLTAHLPNVMDGYNYWIEAVKGLQVCDPNKVNKAVKQATSAIRQEKGEELALLVETAFWEALNSMGRAPKPK